METKEVDQTTQEEAKRNCICTIADQLQRWANLNPEPREKFLIASICSVLGWNPEMYIDLGFGSDLRLIRKAEETTLGQG